MDAGEHHPWGDSPAALQGFDQQAVLMAVLAGPDHRLVALNSRARGLFGERAVLEQPLPGSVPELASQGWLEHFDEVLRSGEVFTGREWRLSLGEGATSRTHYLSLRLDPWCDAHGQVCGVMLQGYDVTQEVLGRVPELEEGVRGREIVSSMQDALLPINLPLTPGLDIGATYALGIGDEARGGDWFDAVLRPSGKVALVVGDAVGRGSSAVAVMGQLRAVLHERLLSGAPLAAALADVERFARATEGAPAATVCVAEVDRDSGEVEYCTAGHPPPVSVGRGGAPPRFWETSGAAPLGSNTTAALRRERLADGELILLYTDGLVHRPGRTVGRSTLELVRVVGDAFAGRTGLGHEEDLVVDRVCQVSLELLTRATGFTDDITVLAAQRVPRPQEFSCEATTERQTASRVREQLRAWLDHFSVRLIDEIVIQHAVGELVTNAVEHAYGGGTGPVVVRARVEDNGTLVASVSDRGTWRSAAPRSGRGTGLPMVRGFSDRLRVDTGEDGTTVELRTALKRPARLLAGQTVGDHESTAPRFRGGPGRVEVYGDWAVAEGDLDPGSADDLRSIGLQLSRGGISDLSVDLRLVTHLGSAVVQLLHELHSELGDALRLLALPGSPAQHVLELVHLPYRTEAADAPPVSS